MHEFVPMRCSRCRRGAEVCAEVLRSARLVGAQREMACRGPNDGRRGGLCVASEVRLEPQAGLCILVRVAPT